jgi:predicted oxidoreductase
MDNQDKNIVPELQALLAQIAGNAPNENDTITLYVYARNYNVVNYYTQDGRGLRMDLLHRFSL